jgi:hydrogenase maturation protease
MGGVNAHLTHLPSFKWTGTVETLVLGLGNPILTDDGVGIHVVRAVAADRHIVPAPDRVRFAEASVGGLRLLDLLVGFDRVILVDAIQTGRGRPGEIYRMGPDDLWWTRHSGSTHDLSLPGALALGRGLEMPLPQDESMTILAIEVEDVLTFGEVCTPAVAAAIPRAAEIVRAALGERQPGRYDGRVGTSRQNVSARR